MAATMYIKRTDDKGGAGEATTFKFSVQGVNYEIDLNKRNGETFMRHMGQWVAFARTVEGVDPKEVRIWAKENGIEVNERGRVPQDVIDAYMAEWVS